MHFPQRSSSAVPLDQQSVLPAVRGVPWWGAVLIATVVTAIGAIMDAKNHGSLGAVFNFCLLVGCCLAALAVRRRALFTAAAQPPLVAFCVGVLALYGLNTGNSSGMRSVVLKVLLPIAANFPWMAISFVVTLVLVVLRWLLTRPEGWNAKLGAKTAPTRANSRRTSSNQRSSTRSRAAEDGSATRASTRGSERTRSDADRRTSSRRGTDHKPSTSRSARPQRPTTHTSDAQPDTAAPEPQATRARPSVVGAAAATSSDEPEVRARRVRAGDAATRAEGAEAAPRRRAGDAARAGARPAAPTPEETTTRIPADPMHRPRPRARTAAEAPDRHAPDAAGVPTYRSTRSRNRT